MAPTKTPKQRPAVKTAVERVQHPSLGNGYAYSHDFRQFTNFLRVNNWHRHPIIQAAQDLYLFPSPPTIGRFRRRMRRRGHLRRFEKQGNNRATVLRGIDFYIIAFWRTVWPKSTHAELNASLFNSQLARGVAHPRFFTPSQISKAEDRLGLSRKRGSTTAYQALTPRNLARRWVYWNCDYPAGIRNIPTTDWIDLDEAGVFVETANRSSGKAYINVRVREEGPYNHSEKWTLTMAISGDEDGDRWLDFEKKSGTTVTDFYILIVGIIDDIGPGTPLRRRCFTFDNLLAHKNPAILNLIVDSGHRFCFRAPYYPVDGAIEYVFNTIERDLEIKLPEIKNASDLRKEVFNTVGAITMFITYFAILGMEY